MKVVKWGVVIGLVGTAIVLAVTVATIGLVVDEINERL